MKVKIYTNPHCPYSEKAKKYLTKKKLEFEEISLFKDEKARFEVINKTGQLCTPVFEINDEIVLGFDELAVKTALEKKLEIV
ncbi:MAG: glutaredoxin domain-containing protein [Candidatus Woesearchaeota archaeon]